MTNNRPNLRNVNRTAGKPQGAAAEQQVYVYFVSLLASTRTGLNVKQIEIFRPQPITTLQDVADLQNYIRTQYPYLQDASVTGFALLRMVPASQLPRQP